MYSKEDIERIEDEQKAYETRAAQEAEGIPEARRQIVLDSGTAMRLRQDSWT